MKVLVCGSREFKDEDLLNRTLEGIDKSRGITEIIHGAAKGADTLSGLYARSRGIPVHEQPALWNTYGRRAGPIRNHEMLKLRPDLVVGFLSKDSRGTKHMLEISDRAGVETIVVDMIDGN